MLLGHETVQERTEQDNSTEVPPEEVQRSEQGLVMTEYVPLVRKKTLNYIPGLRR